MIISRKTFVGVLCIACIAMFPACSGKNINKSVDRADSNNHVAEEGVGTFVGDVKKVTNEQEKGTFAIVDGIETYMEQGQVVKNKLVKVGGKLYYVDDNGHKVKDEWHIIDNDGNYGYFGSLGELVIDKIRVIDGKEYYFDENGILYYDRTEKNIKVIDGVEYIANKNGELRRASDPAPTTTVAPTTRAVTPTTISPQQIAAQQAAAQQAAQQAAAQQAAQQAAAQQTASTNPPVSNQGNGGTLVPNEFGGPGVTGNNTGGYTNQTVAPTTAAATTAKTSNEVKVSRTEKVIDTVEGNDYECKITLLKPIMLSTTEEETMNLNACIDEVMDTWMEQVMALAEGYSTLPKSITFTSVDLGTINKTKIVINITGNIRPKTGSSKTLKYRMTYSREDETIDLTKTSN